MFHYIIQGEGRMGVAVVSEMNFPEMDDYIREHSRKIHPKGHDRVFNIGPIEIVNPKAMTPNDYANFAPYIL